YGRDNWNRYVDDLPPEARQALRGYTGEPPYTGAPGYATYREMNGVLRGDTNLGTPEVRNDIREVDRALPGNPLREDVMVALGPGIRTGRTSWWCGYRGARIWTSPGRTASSGGPARSRDTRRRRSATTRCPASRARTRSCGCGCRRARPRRGWRRSATSVSRSASSCSGGAPATG